MSIESAYSILYGSVIVGLLILIGIMLVRSIIGPRVTDRILSVNMMGTMVICTIAILSRLLNESYLLDVSLIYAMISFVSVLMMAAMFIHDKEKQDNGHTNSGKSRSKKRRAKA